MYVHVLHINTCIFAHAHACTFRIGTPLDKGYMSQVAAFYLKYAHTCARLPVLVLMCSIRGLPEVVKGRNKDLSHVHL